jgi:hypothetical protein
MHIITSSKYIKRKQVMYISRYLFHCFCFIITALLFTSCEQDLNIEIKTNDKRLLVDGEFTNDSIIHRIKLYCSGSLITGKPQTIVSGAKIYVTNNVDTFYYIENKDSLGLYQTNRKCCGKGGQTYFLSISNIDVDKDGKMDLYTASSLMPVPIQFDSLVSKRGKDADSLPAVLNYAYYKTYYNGPDYTFNFTLINSKAQVTLSDELGTGEINAFVNDYYTPKVNIPGKYIRGSKYQSAYNVVKGDTINFNCFNFTTDLYKFLAAFDNNTNGDPILDNALDQLRIPTNVPTNISPSNKAAGYFFIYSVSKISKVFNE